MKATIILCLVLCGCSDPEPFNQAKFQAEYDDCFEASGHSFSDRNAKLIAKECREIAMAVASYGDQQ